MKTRPFSLVVFCAALFPSFFVFPKTGEAFLDTLAEQIAGGIILSAEAKWAADIPSPAFFSLLRAVGMIAPVRVDGSRAVRIWSSAGKPRVDSPDRMKDTLRTIASFCGVPDLEVMTIQEPEPAVPDEDLFRESLSLGYIVVIFRSDSDNMVRQDEWYKILSETLGVEKGYFQKQSRIRREHILVVSGMSGTQMLVPDRDGKPVPVGGEGIGKYDFAVAFRSFVKTDKETPEENSKEKPPSVEKTSKTKNEINQEKTTKKSPETDRKEYPKKEKPPKPDQKTSENQR